MRPQGSDEGIMRAPTTRFLATVLGVLLCSGAPRAAEEPPRTHAYVNGHWFDGRRFVARPFYSMLGELHPNRPWQIDSTVDLHGGYVVPPYGEAHNHNAGMAGEASAAMTARYIREGISYAKNPGNLPGQRVARESLGIDVVYSNGLFTAPDGHPLGLVRRNIGRGVMTEADGEGAFYFTVETRADVDRKWPALLSFAARLRQDRAGGLGGVRAAARRHHHLQLEGPRPAAVAHHRPQGS